MITNPANRRRDLRRDVESALGAEIDAPITAVRSIYDREKWFAQVFMATSGEKIVVSATSARFQAALMPAAWDWPWNAADERESYISVTRAAGLMEPKELDYMEIDE